MYPGHNKDLCNHEVKVREQKCLITELTVLKIASTPSPSLKNTLSWIYILQLVFASEVRDIFPLQADECENSFLV